MSNEKKDIAFEKSFASHIKAIYWSNKNEKKPNEVYKSSGKKYWFDCDCGHDFENSLDKISTGIWCPYCNSSKLCNENNCKMCFEKSFASNSKSESWSSKNEKLPRELCKSTHNKYWFDCNKCNHTFESALRNITIGGNWCPYCCVPQKNVCDDDKCKYCFEKSFASHEKCNEFSKKNKRNPRNILKSSQLKYFFNCKICNHEYDAILGNSSWCPYCAKPSRKLCNDDKCNFCFNNSFASNDKSKYWSSKNQKKPRDIFKGTDTNYLFDCIKCNHEFEISPSRIRSNRWCTICRNKTEAKLLENLKNNYSKIKHQFKKDWCKNKNKTNYLPFDFCIQENNIIIELDGPQHFKQIANWKSPEKTHKCDLYKIKCANQNKYSVIRLLQEDVLDDKYNWLSELELNIEKIVTEKKVQNIFMCKNNEYKIFDNIDYSLIDDSDLSEEQQDTEESNENIFKN